MADGGGKVISNFESFLRNVTNIELAPLQEMKLLPPRTPPKINSFLPENNLEYSNNTRAIKLHNAFAFLFRLIAIL